jgi:anti-anti-sigma regulatory factor
MHIDDHGEQMTHQIQQALQQTAPANLALGDEQLRQIASDVMQALRAFHELGDAGQAKQVGLQFASQRLTSRMLVAVSRSLKPVDQNGTASSEMISDFLTAILDGYVEGAKREVQQTTIADMQATQQREDQLRAVIQELSTPIIPIYRGVLVLPLVGAIDSMRSQEITERLLEEIVRQQADIVIIDITGVSVVDTSVANHLIMTAQAVNLLGSRVIFTGISSTIAQTIIQLGVNLGDVVTLSNLQAGMQFALEQLGLEIAELNAA